MENDERINSTTNNHVNREHIEATPQGTEYLTRENFRLNTQLENMIHSTACQSSENQLATAYPQQPPSYNDIVLNLITDEMQQTSSLAPPTYYEFMRRNNEREREKFP